MSQTLSQKMDNLAHQCKGRKQMTIQEVFDLMDSAQVLFVLGFLYLPLILCFQIPYFYIIVSLLIIGQGIRLALHKKLWLPMKIKKMVVVGDQVAHYLSYAIGFLKKLEKIAHPRGTIYQYNPLLLTWNGCMIALGGCFLFFPIGTDCIPGLGIVVLFFGMLEEDLLWMVFAYGVFTLHIAHIITLLALQNP